MPRRTARSHAYKSSKMCYQLVEVYSACECLYYQHPLDRCRLCGISNHEIERKVVRVGYACARHDVRRDSISAQPRREFRNMAGCVDDLLTGNSFSTSTTQRATVSQEDGETDRKSGRSASTIQETQNIIEPDLDSDSESVISQSSTAVSVASSTTAVEADAVEAIFHRLLYFKSLRYLWPQLITSFRGSRKRCLRTIAGFLKHYADDLGRLATKESLQDYESSICLSACRFVRKSRYSLAPRLWEAHWHGSDVNEDDVDNPQVRQLLGLTEDKSYDLDDSDFAYSVAERFLFNTEPIQALEASVKAFVKMNVATEDGRETLPGLKFVQTYFANIITEFRRPISKPGTQRVSWTCVSRQSYHSNSSQMASSCTL